MGLTTTSFVLLMFVLLFVATIVHIIVSRRASFAARLGWAVLAVLFPFLGYALFLIITEHVRHAHDH